METYWDWLTVIAFAGLVTLLLQRSSEEHPQDELWQYAPPPWDVPSQIVWEMKGSICLLVPYLSVL